MTELLSAAVRQPHRIPAPYDERNIADFVQIGKNISLAVDQIAADKTIPATEESLANLAGCSRGTLRNRQWPLVRLREIKQARKTEAEKKLSERQKEKPKSTEAELVDQLNASRTEAARWYDKNQELGAENSKLRRQNVLLQQQNDALRNGRSGSVPSVADRGTANSHPSSGGTGNVAQFPDRQSQ
jgi:hypothetical protein